MIHFQILIPRSWAFRSLPIAAVLHLATSTALAGTWTPLQHPAPGKVQLMLLLPDGTVMAANPGTGTNISSAWYRLTPDSSGSYVNGTWTTLASMANTRLWYSSVVLRDGRVFVAGAEYGTGAGTAEIYDPQANVWTPVAVSTNVLDPTQPWSANTNVNQAFQDSDAMLLPDGRVLVAPVYPQNLYDTLIYDPVTNGWSVGPLVRANNQNEASWVKLPDDSILTIDAGSTTTERYLPDGYLAAHAPPITANQWIADTTVPVAVYGNPGNEIGPAMLLADGTAFFVGGNGNSAIYTPSGDNTPGTWQVGPVLPNVIQYPLDNNGNEMQGAAFTTAGAPPDAPAASLVNGRVLYAFSGQLYNDPRAGTTPIGASNNFWKNAKNPLYPAPTTFFVYDPPTKTFTPIPGPTGVTDDVPTYKTAMLTLPDGTVLFAHQGTDLYVYSLDPVHFPDDRIDPSSRPTIQSITLNPDASWHLTGTQLNGLSQGATYGDDAQMDCNYPLIRLTAESGEITYARTLNWSSTGVRTGNKVVSTDFVIPPVIAGTGTVSLAVVANGIASSPTPFPLVLPGETLTFSGNSSMGSGDYEIRGGITTFQDDLSASGILLRGPGGTIQLLDSATAATASVLVDGGMGNGGIPAYLEFKNNSTAAQASIENRPGVLGPNFKNASPNPTAGLGGETRFFDSALAGTAHIVNSAAAFGSSYDAAITSFEGSASADHAVIVNKGVSAVANYSYAYGGETEFTGSATAGFATFTNLNSNNGTPYSQGRTVFFDTANAGQGLFINLGGDGGFLETGGTTEFRGNSSATNGTFYNRGGTGGSFPGPGKTQFFDYAVAGTGSFTNGPGVAGGGAVEFHGHASADHGSFVNQTDPALNGGGGTIAFYDNSTAAFASIAHRGYQGGATDFHNQSSAGHATIVLEAHPNYNNSRVSFWDVSSAGDADITIGAVGTLLQFYGNSSASNATITIGGNASFNDTSTAGNATITVLGTQVAGDGPGSLGFTGSARTGNANFIVQGATVNAFGTGGGVIAFDYGGSAGSATFTVNGGSNGGPGGRMTFGRGGNGGQARFIVNNGGTLDFGGTTLYGGATAGSLEGAGTVLLSSSTLTVGSPNTSTTFSGEIADGQLYYAGVGGQLIKVGTGSFTLSGSNSYSGLTTVAAGTLAVNGSLVGDVQVNGGATLKGSGNIGGTVTVLPGGIIAPGNSPGTLTIGGNYSQASQGLLEIEVAGPNASDYDHLIVNSNINLSGKLLLVFSGYAPSATDTFTVIQAGGALTVSNLEIVVLGLKPGYQPNYQVSGGSLTITATSSGQLRTGADPIQTLPPSFTPQSGFVYSVFTLAGLTYQFDTSTDLITWTPVSEVPGANVLFEFRNIPAAGDSHRFYRVVQKSGTP